MRRRIRDSGSGGRGQTVQDFAIGASIFLLTTAFVFAFVPSIFAPFSSDVTAGSAQAADRVASQIIEERSVEHRRNWLIKSEAQNLMGMSQNQLRKQYGLSRTTQINVQIVRVDPDSNNGQPVSALPNHAGTKYNDRPAASVSRIVVIDGIDACDPSDGSEGNVCRLIVRVW